jgi:TPR repeat protein
MTSKEEDINRKQAAAKLGESDDFVMPVAPPINSPQTKLRSAENKQSLNHKENSSSITISPTEKILIVPPLPFDVSNPKSWTITAIKDDALAMACLGDAFSGGGFFPYGINKDIPIGLSLLEQSAQLGHPLGLYLLSRAQRYLPDCRRHPHEANITESKAVKAGFLNHNGEGGAVWWLAEAIANLGGRILPINEKRALALIQKCLDIDYTDAWVTYAVCLLGGKGIKKNVKEAIEWLRRAVEMKNGAAMAQLAKCYVNAWGVKKDDKTALIFYDQAVKEGQDDALNSLGYCSSNGIGCKKNKEQALEYYMKAASLNNPSGMYNVGYYYENGIACLKDKKAAQFWYAKAVALGNERSVEGLKRIGKVK